MFLKVNIKLMTMWDTMLYSLEDRYQINYKDNISICHLLMQEPVPPKPWQGVWNATQPGAMCLQCRRLPPRMYNTTDPITGDEDCLFLNIYTPKVLISK